MSPRAIDRLAQVWPPMLATKSLPKDVTRAYDVIEVKYDGFRALAAATASSVALHSRNALDLAARFPSVAKALEHFCARDVVLDGELVGAGFHSLQLASGAIDYAVFDLLWLGGEDLRARPLIERRRLLAELLAGSPPNIVLAERLPADLTAALRVARTRALEGVVCKIGAAAYHGGRRTEWRKVKLNTAGDFEIVGFTPHSASARQIGALLLAMRDGRRLRYAGKVGTGFTSALRAQLFGLLSARAVTTPVCDGAPRLRDAIWVRRGVIAEIEYSEVTRDLRLRHPVFKRLREDKARGDAYR